jgi:hypothetical protein
VAERLLKPAPEQEDDQELRGEAWFAQLLDQPVDTAIRIVPTRSTDFTHLRDGFYRAVTGRLKLASQRGQVSEAEAEQIAQSLQTFQGFFPKGSVPKGKALLLLRRSSDGALLVEYEGKHMGTLENRFISTQLFLAYFADKNPISQKFKESVAKGLEEASHR